MKQRNGKAVVNPTAADNQASTPLHEEALPEQLDAVERRPEPEVLERATRRRYNARYKLKVLQETDSLEDGQVGAYLRREGLYWSLLSTWRRQREEGTLSALEARTRGRKSSTPAGTESRRVLEVEKEKAKLQERLDQTLLVLEIQKKVLSLCELAVLRPPKSMPS